ncbi:MAG: RNA-binding S4 domain-containing protein [bacterium]
MRLDKWLWCARFFKTRKLAAEAISGGKVHLNGQRTKPGKEITVGNHLEISKNGVTWDITVDVLPKQRRPASEAQTFYTEPQDSIERRYRETAEIRAARAAESVKTPGRPTKRDRRLIHRFKQNPGD